jgi:sec-independent protein translocase protein TatC
MARKKTQAEIDEEIEDELEDEWEDHGQSSAGAIILRTFGEIRKRVIIIVGTLIFFSCIAGWFCIQIFNFLMVPLCAAFGTTPNGAPGMPTDAARSTVGMIKAGGCAVYPADMTEPMIVYFKMSVLIGFICTLPVLFWQAWQFASRWIPEGAQRWILVFVTSASLMFVGGSAFGYYVVFPKAFAFLLTFGGAKVIPMPTMESYYSIISLLLIGFGVIFELPLLMIATSKVGLTNAAFFTKYRRHAIFLLMLFAAFICPSTDPFTYLSMGIPLVVLFEVGIIASRMVGGSGPTLLQQRFADMRNLIDEGDDEDDDDEDED